jgi:BASS family bile acid:Na+ symporter
MTMDQVINLLVTITVVEMMIAIGLGVTFAELVRVGQGWPLLTKAFFANYVAVPAVTVGLLLLYRVQPMVAAGYLILAVCPGAPFGPPLAAIARGNKAVSVGLMVILSGSSVFLAPLLLHFLLPLMAGSETANGTQGIPPKVDAVQIGVSLLGIQLVPLCVGLAVRHWRPELAKRVQKPANRISAVLNVVVTVVILIVQGHLLAEIRPVGFVGMLVLLIASLAAGWLLGGPGSDNRKTLALTTSLRNVGVSLVIATGGIFAGTPAGPAVMVYGWIEIFGSLFLALVWGRRTSGTPLAEETKMQASTNAPIAKGTRP